FTPNVEAIAEYHPDLVVIAYDPGELRASLRKLHIRVVLQDAAKTLREAYGQIDQLGSITGHRKQAQAVIGRMKRQIAKLVSHSPTRSAAARRRGRLRPGPAGAVSLRSGTA